jgi:ribosomal protein S12 methylthiotransferase accessory factor
MTIGLVGSGPAVSAIEAALSDVDASVERIDVESLDAQYRLGIVVGQAGAPAFDAANDIALEAELPWFAVELGGIGSVPVVDGAVVGFDPTESCYDCLRTRVQANVDPDTEPQAAPSDPTARYVGATAGRRICRHLDPTEADQFGTIAEVPHSERELHPVPGCRCGSDRDRVLDRGHLERDLGRSLGRAQRGLDGRVGLVRDIGEANSYPAPYYLAQLCSTDDFSDATAQQQAAGVDENWDRAFMKALGESLERYCAGVYRTAEFRTATADEVSSPVTPSSFVSPDDWTDPDATEEQIDWIRGDALDTGDRVHLPAELVHYPPHEKTIRPAITTGLGLGNSTVGAVLSGLYEVLERDAATIAWYSSFEPLELVVGDDAFERLASRAGTNDLEVTPLLLTQDVDVPVVAVAVYRDEWPRFALGTAANLDPAAAANGALAEALQNWQELDGMGREGAEDASGAIGRYAERPEVVEPFVDPENTVPASSVGPDPVPDGTAELTALLDRLDDVGLDGYAVRTTTRDVQRLGFEAVRVLVPEAQPLFFGDAYFGERARTVPETLGFEARLDRDHHPYP